MGDGVERKLAHRRTEVITPDLAEETRSTWLEIDHAIDQTKNRQMFERSEKYTVVDYLTMPQPRTQQPLEALNARLVLGHGSITDHRRDQAMHMAQAMSAM